ncbi:MAG TPA: hypothetical protein VN673_16060 [Clostridia bacterium]|nr:hypothetical protein [Clostridia bacterium]
MNAVAHLVWSLTLCRPQNISLITAYFHLFPHISTSFHMPSPGLLPIKRGPKGLPALSAFHDFVYPCLHFVLCNSSIPHPHFGLAAVALAIEENIRCRLDYNRLRKQVMGDAPILECKPAIKPNERRNGLAMSR